MERDEHGRALAKTGRCGVCGKRQRVLADEDFDCCDRYEKEEEEERHEPMTKMIIVDNCDQRTFSVKDVIIAMIGEDWKDFTKLLYQLRTFGFDFCMMIDKDTLIHILEELEEDGMVEVYWDTERISRVEPE